MTHVLRVSLQLPFFLRVEGGFSLEYSALNIVDKIPELLETNFKLSFSKSAHLKSFLVFEIESKEEFDDDFVGIFSIIGCRQIIQLIVRSYQSVTGSWSNQGLIRPIGTSYMQLNAQIEKDGENFRDRMPFESVSTFPFTASEKKMFLDHLTNKVSLNLSKIYFAEARELLERGSYSISYIQTARAVETAITEYIVDKMKNKNRKKTDIDKYKRLSLGLKLRNDKYKKGTDEKLETHFGSYTNWTNLFSDLIKLKDKRNDIIHHSDDASRDEALKATEVVKEFFSLF